MVSLLLATVLLSAAPDACMPVMVAPPACTACQRNQTVIEVPVTAAVVPQKHVVRSVEKDRVGGVRAPILRPRAEKRVQRNVQRATIR